MSMTTSALTPNASLSEAILAAGFGSRQTYYAVKGKSRP